MSHYYARDGKPCYEVTGANGKIRATHLGDARKMDLAVGVTTILKVASSDGLTNWRINETIKACMQNPYCAMGMDPKAWTDSIKKDASAKLDKASDRGKEIHGALEEYYKTGRVDKKDEKIIVPVINSIQEIPSSQSGWVAEETFNYEGLFGGSVDLHTRDNWNTGEGIIIDFKTKDKSDIKDLKGYVKDVQQLAAYRMGLGLPGARLINIYISVAEGCEGLHVVKEHTVGEIDSAWEMFKLLCQYWHLDNKVNPNCKELLDD